MTDIPEVTEARKRLDAFVGNLRDRACLTCGECAYEGMAHSMDVATCFSGVYADIATLSDTIEKLTRDNEAYRENWEPLKEQVRSLRAQHVVGLECRPVAPSNETEKPMLPNQKKPNLTIEDVAVIPCPACAEPTLHISRGEEKCCLQCAADGGSTMPGYVPLSKFNRWSE